MELDQSIIKKYPLNKATPEQRETLKKWAEIKTLEIKKCLSEGYSLSYSQIRCGVLGHHRMLLQALNEDPTYKILKNDFLKYTRDKRRRFA